MGVSIEDIKKLKELTGIGLTDAKAALTEANGDFDKALEAMRKKGLTKAEKKGDRETREGLVESYVHSGRIGVVVEVNCETDFVARLPEFKEFAHQIAMQIAAMNPLAVDENSIPADVVAREKAIAIDVVKAEGKPAEMAEKIAMGKLNKFFKDNTLMAQAFVKDGNKSVAEFLKSIDGDLKVTEFKRVALG